MIREAEKTDAKAISDIYNYYVLNTAITFEIEPVSCEEMSSRIEKYKQIGPYYVYQNDIEIIAYSYVSKFAGREAYRNTVASTIYVKHGYNRQGIGFELYSTLLKSMEDRYHSVVAVVALPNEASVRLHEKCGFKNAGRLSEAGRKFDKWIDVGYWQKINRHSSMQPDRM